MHPAKHYFKHPKTHYERKKAIKCHFCLSEYSNIVPYEEWNHFTHPFAIRKRQRLYTLLLDIVVKLKKTVLNTSNDKIEMNYVKEFE